MHALNVAIAIIPNGTQAHFRMLPPHHPEIVDAVPKFAPRYRNDARRKFKIFAVPRSEAARATDPCPLLLRRLHEKLREQGLDQLRELGGADDITASAARESLKGLLQADIQRIQLRECENGGTFCLEVAVRTQLLDVGTGKPVYDTVFVYSNPMRRTDESTIEAFYSEFSVPPPSACRKLAAFCGDGGRELVREERTRVLDLLAEKILRAPAQGKRLGFVPGENAGATIPH